MTAERKALTHRPERISMTKDSRVDDAAFLRAIAEIMRDGCQTDDADRLERIASRLTSDAGFREALEQARNWFAGYVANGGKYADEELRAINQALAHPVELK